VLEISPTVADIATMYIQHLFYCIAWPHGSSPLDLIAAIQGRLCHYSNGTENIIFFNKYQDASAKDHERMW